MRWLWIELRRPIVLRGGDRPIDPLCALAAMVAALLSHGYFDTSGLWALPASLVAITLSRVFIPSSGGADGGEATP